MAPLLPTIHQGQVEYLFKEKSFRQIARNSKVPVKVLSNAYYGRERIPTQYLKDFRKYYTNESYKRLRDTGMSTRQAARFAGSSVTNITQASYRTNEIIEHLTQGVLGSRKQKLEGKGFAFEYEFEYDKARASIWEGLRKSKKSIEQWESY